MAIEWLRSSTGLKHAFVIENWADPSLCGQVRRDRTGYGKRLNIKCESCKHILKIETKKHPKHVRIGNTEYGDEQ